MWKRLKELNEQRGQLLADMKKLLTTAETEKRDLSVEENTQFDGLHQRAEALKVQIDQHQRAHDVERDVAAANGGTQQRQQPGRENLNTPEQAIDAKAAEARRSSIPSSAPAPSIPTQKREHLPFQVPAASWVTVPSITSWSPCSRRTLAFAKQGPPSFLRPMATRSRSR